MERKNLPVLTRLLVQMKQSAVKLEEAYKNKDVEHLAMVKKEILELQKKVDKLLW